MRITGIGTYLPERIVTNEELAREMQQKCEMLREERDIPEGDPRLKQLETSDDWIRERTGIRERHVAAPDEAASDLAIHAANKALEMSGLRRDRVGFILMGTVYPDCPHSPSTAALVAKGLGISASDCSVKDVGNACCSFVSALEDAYGLINGGIYRAGIVIGADVMSRTVSHYDRSFYPLMGDAGGALVLEETTTSQDWFRPNWFLAGVDPARSELISAPAGGSREPITAAHLTDPLCQPHKLRMDGPEVFEYVLRILPGVVDRALTKAGVALEEVGCISIHQMNERIIRGAEKRLRRDGFRGAMPVTIDRFANTTSASILLGYKHACEENIITPGMLVLFIAVGGGMTWATALFRQGSL